MESNRKYCQLMIGLEGNKDPDLPEIERHQRSLVILEDREFGETGRIHLQYSQESGTLEEIEMSLGE